MEAKYYIYSIVANDIVVYIGQLYDPQKRDEIFTKNQNLYKHLNGVYDEGGTIEMKILDECNRIDADMIERKYIRIYFNSLLQKRNHIKSSIIKNII